MKIFHRNLSIPLKIFVLSVILTPAYPKILMNGGPLKKKNNISPERRNQLNGLMMKALGDVLLEKHLKPSPKPRELSMANQTLLRTDNLGVNKRRARTEPQPIWDSKESKRLQEIERQEKRREHEKKYGRSKRELNVEMNGDFEETANEDAGPKKGSQSEYFALSEELQEKNNEHHEEQEEMHHEMLIKEQEDMFKLQDESGNEEEEMITPVGVQKAEDETKLYLSSFPRIMKVVSTITTLYNLYTDVIPDEIAQSDLIEKTEQGLKTYQKGKDFFNIVINESALYKEEVDNFFKNSTKTLVTLDEMMIVTSLDSYYENVKSKVDTKESQFIKLDNQLKFEVNDFVDKFRYFLVAIDSLRNISEYMYIEMKPFEEKYLGSSVLNVLDKIDQGVNMVDAILQLKIKAEGLLTHLTDGVAKITVVRNNMVEIIREMHKLIPVTSDSIVSQGRLSVTWGIIIALLFFWFSE